MRGMRTISRIFDRWDFLFLGVMYILAFGLVSFF
jgi:hypothetical protein